MKKLILLFVASMSFTNSHADSIRVVRPLIIPEERIFERLFGAHFLKVIDPPILKSFSDSHDWMLTHDLIYSIGNTRVEITVPKGFVTDFASIPQPLWSLGISPLGKYTKAAIVHDYLYWVQNCTKDQADNILLIAMKESEVGSWTETEIYEGVHLAGKPSWKSNSEERSRQLPKIIPPQDQNFPGNVTWVNYRKTLTAKGVKDPAFPISPAYCKYGDSSNVPKI